MEATCEAPDLRLESKSRQQQLLSKGAGGRRLCVTPRRHGIAEQVELDAHPVEGVGMQDCLSKRTQARRPPSPSAPRRSRAPPLFSDIADLAEKWPDARFETRVETIISLVARGAGGERAAAVLPWTLFGHVC